MNLIRANQASKTQVEHFLETNEGINREDLLETGYVMMVDGEIEGCFNLESVDEGYYWLKQLYITKSKANVLPFLLEAILTVANEQQAKRVDVHSHQQTVNNIVGALQV